MPTARSLVALDFGFADGTDVSRKAHAVRRVGMLEADRSHRRMKFKGAGFLEVASSEALAKLDSFTVEVEFSVDRIGGPQQVLEGQSLPVSLRVDKDGTIVAAVQTTQGWESVDSGARKLASQERVTVRIVHDAGKSLRLEVDDRAAGTTPLKGALRRTGSGGLLIGAKSEGKAQAFRGSVGLVRVRDSAVDAIALATRERWAADMAARLKKHLRFDGRIYVEPDPDAVDHRFETIKGILRAAGVQDVSQLATLRIDRRTVVAPNMLLIAPRKVSLPPIDWGTVAGTIATAEVASAVLATAAALPNRNSRAVLRKAAGAAAASAAANVARAPIEARAEIAPRLASAARAGSPPAALGAMAGALRSTTGLRRIAALDRPTLREVVRPARGIEFVDPDLPPALESDRPADWPAQSMPIHSLLSLVTIPINTSVIIAGTLDLTNQQLVIEPNVETLYIIAEEIVGAPDAAITWRRPGGSTPAMADDPAKNGRSYSGVHTAEGSRSGLRGGDVAIGVLEGTLATTVTARAFKIANQGGQPGRGGDGGPGGMGGAGGTHGNDYVDGEEVCGDGVDGTRGAQGQPGATGPDGRAGQSGTLSFFEFTEESRNEQLTRPWLYELTPVQAFPGNTLNITGTRFADTGRVVLDTFTLTPTILADESLAVTIPSTIAGGEKEVFVRRFDGTESNRLRLWIKPQLDAIAAAPVPGSTMTLAGKAFLAGASVGYDGAAIPATDVTRTSLKFVVPSAGTGDSAERNVSIAVRNPDGLVSNARTITIPRIVDSGLRVDVHGLSFPNFDVGAPSWGTFEDTFGAFEVWHELLDPVFGHPVLTTAFYIFYEHFLKGEGAGGLATGFCTSLSAKVLDEFWTGSTDTFTRISLTDAVRRDLTAIHGRLLSRESLIDFHDQGRNGTANVATSFRRIEQNLRDGGGRESCLMLFFVPSGAAWDGGYFEKLGDSHCTVPYRIVYPAGHDGTSIAGVKLFYWDCNHPFSTTADAALNCRLEFRLTDGELRFDYFDGGATPRFSSEDGITLATMTNGKYLLSDHDMPFSGPLGLRTFLIDVLLSPADLLIENEAGQRWGCREIRSSPRSRTATRATSSRAPTCCRRTRRSRGGSPATRPATTRTTRSRRTACRSRSRASRPPPGRSTCSPPTPTAPASASRRPRPRASRRTSHAKSQAWRARWRSPAWAAAPRARWT